MREKITLLFILLFMLFVMVPPGPQFQCCFDVWKAVAKRSVYFETFVSHQCIVNIEIGGRGVRRQAQTHINTRSVIISRTGVDSCMRQPIETNGRDMHSKRPPQQAHAVWCNQWRSNHDLACAAGTCNSGHQSHVDEEGSGYEP